MTLLATADVDELIEQTLTRKAARLEVVAAWDAYRAAVREHNAAKRTAGTPFFPGPVSGADRLDALGLGLPTFSTQSIARDVWMRVAADYRAAHPLPAAEGAAYVAKMGNAYEVVCPSHPRFRRIAWTHQRTPATSAREHNAEHHDGAPVVIMTRTDRSPSSLLPRRSSRSRRPARRTSTSG